MAFVYSNSYFARVGSSEINHETDTIKVAIMASGFTFDRDAHDNWSQVSASEIAAGNGYTANGVALSAPTETTDDTNDRAQWAYPNLDITASGGDFPAAAGVLYYDDTHANDAIIGYFAFASAETITDGNYLRLTNQTFRLAQAA